MLCEYIFFSFSHLLLSFDRYALNAVAGGATTLGIKATNGVVLATEKKIPSPLVDETSWQKVSLITSSTGLVYAGMGPDARYLH